MAQLPISEAAKCVSRDRKTLYRLIKEGKLSATVSATGVRQVDTNELLRVFGEIKTPDTGSKATRDSAHFVSLLQGETENSTAQIALLEAELRHARDMAAAKDQLLAAKDSQIEDLRSSLRLLEAPRQAEPVQEPKPGFWTKPRKLFGVF